MLTSQKNGNIQIEFIKTDILTIVNCYGWKRSFARVSTNLKAIKERGWEPLNQAALSYHQIARTKKESPY